MERRIRQRVTAAKTGKRSPVKKKRKSRDLKRPVCIYVDNSNIFIGGKETAKARAEDGDQLRIAFSNFLFLVTGGTLQYDELVWAGSGDEDTEAVFAGLREKGADLQIIPRAEGGENETVDQAMQLAMYRHARKYRDHPGTMVLCTGDGKGCSEEKGFLFDIRGFIADGWQVVLYSWDAVCHQALKEFVTAHGRYVPLDAHYAEITFVKNGREAADVVLG